MMIDRRMFLRGLALSGLGPTSILAAAENYPDSNRQIRIIVPAVAGGGLDLAARLVAQQLAEIWKQKAYIENRPGANCIIGMNAVATAEPDGYTLLVVSNAGLSINPLVFPNVPFDPLRDLTPVVAITRGAFVLVVHPSVPATTLSDFTAHLKANPGKLNHATNSASTILLAELFKDLAHVEFVNISYKGGAQAITDTLAGMVQFCFSDLGSALPAIQSGQLRALGVTTSQRYEIVPELPTLSEQLPGLVMDGGILLVAPAKTSSDILDKLNGVVRQALARPDVTERLLKMGNLPGGRTRDQVQQALRSETERWRKLTKERDIHLEN
jgi:tripartite-type tricarboxylate transporter receptor subunit TctC